MDDRRKRRRFVIEATMEALLHHVDGSKTKGHVVDLNNIGAFIATDLVLEKGTPVKVELCIPDLQDSFLINAVVARRAERVSGRAGDLPAGLGLMFLADDEEEETFIQNAVIVALERALERARARVAAAPSR